MLAGPCKGDEFDIEASAPTSGGSTTARLHVRRGHADGMAGAEKYTCLKVGDHAQIIPPGGQQEIEIAADPIELQRMRVMGRPVLVPVRPSAELTIGHHDCFFWELGGLDDETDLPGFLRDCAAVADLLRS